MVRWLSALFLFTSSLVLAQSSAALLNPVISRLAGDTGLPVISSATFPSHPFSVVGPNGALLGQQDGTYEAWVFPWKIFSGMRITAEMENYPIPIDVNRCSSVIEVRPDRTTITYSHANFTIRQSMLAPKSSPNDTGVLAIYEIEAVRPMTLTFSFDPVMRRMWPAPSEDPPAPEWVKREDGKDFYLLHLNFPDQAAGIAMPDAAPGILPPYQEFSAAWPLQFVLHFDPAINDKKIVPLLIALGGTPQGSGKAAVAGKLAALAGTAATLADANSAYYRNLLAGHTRLETPDARMNAAFDWAMVAIDQLRVNTGSGGEALAAGFTRSGDTTRPGFGWFFGRDALWSIYALDSYGEFDAVRDELSFLGRNQRADGKIMHERSQTADLVDWNSLPYQWAACDATPLFLMAAADYLSVSGDSAFIEKLWPNLERAWRFENAHDSGDIFDNSEGTGWVESWVPSAPHQEIYLAALDEQASTSFAHLAKAAGHDGEAREATQRAGKIGRDIEQSYYRPQLASYAFSRNSDGSTDDTATIFPALAWWDGTFGLEHAEPMLERWSSSEFSTDWGTRILSNRTSFYDPISYHQGTVWPLFTGWVSVAEYRAGHPISAYAHLMQNVDLTWAQDLGSVTELMSGEFYQMLGRSTSHQLWSSAMVISPIMRGLFGLEWDAERNTLFVTPHLPVQWPRAALHNIPFGNSHLDLEFSRYGGKLRVAVKGGPENLHLASRAAGATLEGGMLVLPLPAVEAGVDQELPAFGAATRQLKVLREGYGPHELVLSVSAPGGTVETVQVRKNEPAVNVIANGGTLTPSASGLSKLEIQFPPSIGYVDKVVTLSW